MAPDKRPRPLIRKPPHGTDEYVEYLKAKFDRINAELRDKADLRAAEKNRRAQRQRRLRQNLPPTLRNALVANKWTLDPPTPPPAVTDLPRPMPPGPVSPEMPRRFALKDANGRLVGYATMK